MPQDLVKVRLLEPLRLFHIGSEVLVTADVAAAWCAPGRGVAEYVDPPAKKRGRPKKQTAVDEEPPPAPLGLSTQDLV